MAVILLRAIPTYAAVQASQPRSGLVELGPRLEVEALVHLHAHAGLAERARRAVHEPARRPVRATGVARVELCDALTMKRTSIRSVFDVVHF